jgi:hypothetical protein
MTAQALPTAMASDESPLRPGQLLVHRLFTQDRLACVRTGVVVSHDERGLCLWYATGNPGLTLETADGRRIRDLAFAQWVALERELGPAPWIGPDILMYVPPGAAHAVWFFYHPDGAFRQWYVNLEEPAVLWSDGEIAGVDTVDQDLDVDAFPDRTWAWKDEDEFAERLLMPEHYWVPDEAAVRSEGRKVIEHFTAGAFPFDGTWCDWRPDPAWQRPTVVPAAAHRPRVHYGQ